MTLLPDLNTQRSLANTLGVVLYVEHHRGNDTGAVETIRDLNFVADAMQQFLPTLVSHLVGIGIGTVTSNAAINLSREMAIADKSSATRPGSAANRAQVFQLIADLSDERQYRLGGIRSLYGERTGALDSIKAIPMQATASTSLYVFRSAFQLDVINMLHAETQVSQAMGQPTLASARALMPNIQSMHNRRGIAMLTHLLSSMLTPSLNRFVVTHFRGLTDRRGGDRAGDPALALRSRWEMAGVAGRSRARISGGGAS